MENIIRGSVVVVSYAVLFAVFAVTPHGVNADDSGWYDTSYTDSYSGSGGGGFDTGWYDTAYTDSYSYSDFGSGWYDTSYTDSYSDLGTGWYDTSYNDSYSNWDYGCTLCDTGWYDTSYTDSYYPSSNTGWYDTAYTDSYYPESNTGWYDTSYTDSYYASNNTGWYDTAYTDSYYSSPVTNTGWYDTAYTDSYRAPQAGYSTPSYQNQNPYRSSYSTPSYASRSAYSSMPTTQRPYNFSAPSYSNYPRYTSTPTTIAAPITIAYPQTIVQPAPVYPQQPTYPAPTCSITLTSNYNQSYQYGNWYGSSPATLAWSSANATSASISGIGSVSTNVAQTRTVYPTNGQSYTMTVSGRGGSNICQTHAFYLPTPITPLPPVQPPVTPPVYPPVPPQYGHVSCAINANPSVIANGQRSTLSWSSSAGVTNATLSDGLGAVNPNGHLSVMPNGSRTYTLTVYGQGTSATCNTYVTVSGGAPYVSLSQIPYTGFDFGPVGNAVYFMSLLAFAVAGAYLAVYYVPNSRAFAGFAMPSMPSFALPARKKKVSSTFAREMASAHEPQAPAAVVPQVIELPAAHTAPVTPVVHAAIQNLPTANYANTTTDTMTVIRSKAGSAPRIIITRA